MTLPFEAFLRREFGADDGSFLLQLRINLSWDEARFGQLVEAMTACCEYLASGEHEQLDRWFVDGFWTLHTFTPSWVRHPAFPRPRPPEYYETAFELLEILADWAFTGVASFQVDLRTLPEYAPYYPRETP